MKSKKKIVHLIKILNIGGCEKVLLRTLPLIQDFDHLIITLKSNGALDGKFKEAGINIISIEQKSLFDIFSYFRLIKIIRNTNPEIIMSYLFHADFIGRIILKLFVNKKIVSYLVTTYNSKRYWPARFFERLTRNISDEYVAISKSVKNFYVEKLKINTKKINVIQSGLRLEDFQVKTDNDFRKDLGIPINDIIISCVANLHINKGHKFLIEAFEALFQENKKIHLLIIGDGNERENLVGQSSRLVSCNNIHFLGQRNDVPLILSNSNIFALASFFEGLSTATMEAMASGLAVAVSDISENKDLVENMKNGVLFAPGNVDDIYEKLKILIDDNALRQNLGQAAKSTILEKHNIQAIAKQWDDFFNNLSKTK